jgi:hypothetical protein
MVPKFSPAVTVWGGISNLGLTPLVSVSGNISAIKYREILEEGLLLSNIVTNNLPYVLQLDNDRPHTATYTRDWFTRNHVTVMEWPAASLDLNPIENVWQIMEDRVEKIQPDNITDWKVTIMETWMGLDQNYTDSLVESMNGVSLCIDRHGGLTDY